ncbi:MAG: aminodeoxychorismate/anthranilate synthase component II [Verrucomicrobiota bacterium]
MLLVIDNFDSFTYNLVQYFGELGVEQKVVRNNEITPEEAWGLNPERILISPGPCSPTEAGVSLAMIDKFAGKRPLLGVCLGHQSIGHHFGGKVIRTPQLMHGKTSSILHAGKGLFAGLDSPLTATRYHSLIIEKETIPHCLEITAETEDGIIMAVQHKEYPVYGVQFHPESYATQDGKKMLENFLNH